MSTANKLHTFTVEGGGSFPYDMLRYDECFPAAESESGLMQSHETKHRIIQLRAWQSSWWTPTDARWDSFNWVVADHSYE